MHGLSFLPAVFFSFFICALVYYDHADGKRIDKINCNTLECVLTVIKYKHNETCHYYKLLPSTSVNEQKTMKDWLVYQLLKFRLDLVKLLPGENGRNTKLINFVESQFPEPDFSMNDARSVFRRNADVLAILEHFAKNTNATSVNLETPIWRTITTFLKTKIVPDSANSN